MLEPQFILLALRVVIGLLFMGHGLQKLFGWFGGGGLDGTAEFLEKLNIHPPYAWAVLTSLTETLGGLALVLGLLTPLAAAAIIGTMLIAIIKVHGKNGLWNKDGGIEYNLVLTAIAASLGFAGPGAYALDRVLDLTYPMPITFIVSLIAVVIGLFVVLISSDIVEYIETELQS
jgi:putative oxidoreductase